MLDELWFNRVSRNAESAEDIDEATINVKVNVQMDFKRVEESDIEVRNWPLSIHFRLSFNGDILAGPITTRRQASPHQSNEVAPRSSICVANQLGRARVKC